MKLMAVEKISVPTGVKNIKKYVDKDRKGFAPYKKGTPVHVKSAIAYNDLLKYHKI